MNEKIQTASIAGIGIATIAAGVTSGQVSGTVAAICITIITSVALIGRYYVAARKGNP